MRKLIIFNELTSESFEDIFLTDADMHAWLDAGIASNRWGFPKRKVREVPPGTESRILYFTEKTEIDHLGIETPYIEYTLKADYKISYTRDAR